MVKLRTFEEKLRLTGLPTTAKLLLPQLLSDDTKNRLLQCDDMESVISSAIDKIEAGSTERLEVLVLRRLDEQ